jgi:hypothetical protein
MRIHPGAKSRRLKAKRGGAKGEGGESRKAPVAHGRLAEAASNVVQLRDKFTEISPQPGCKTKRTVSGRAARDKACAMKKGKIAFSKHARFVFVYTHTRALHHEERKDRVF